MTIKKIGDGSIMRHLSTSKSAYYSNRNQCTTSPPHPLNSYNSHLTHTVHWRHILGTCMTVVPPRTTRIFFTLFIFSSSFFRLKYHRIINCIENLPINFESIRSTQHIQRMLICLDFVILLTLFYDLFNHYFSPASLHFKKTPI